MADVANLTATINVSGASRAASDLSKVDQAGERAGISLGKLGKAAALAGAGIAAGLAVGIGATVKVAADFESSLQGVAASLYDVGKSADENAANLAALRKEALAVGRDSSKSASETVAAFGDLAKSGISTEAIVSGVGRTVVNLSEATGASVQDMATLMAQVTNVFKIPATEIKDAANVLGKAANASAIDINDLRMSMAAGGLVAENAGLSVDQFATAIGILGDQGLRGSDAGTSLKAAIAGLTPASVRARNAMQDLNFTAFDTQGNFKAFPDILADLSKSFSGLTEEQRATTAELLFGSDGIRAFNALVPDTTKGLADATEQWGKFGEKTAQQADIDKQAALRMQGLAGSIERLKGSLETIAIEIGSKFLPMITPMVEMLAAKLPGAFTKVSEAVGRVLPTLKSIGQTVITTIMPALERFATFMTEQVVPALRDFIGEDVLPKLETFGTTLRDTILPAAQELARVLGETLKPALDNTIGFIAENKEILAGFAITIGVLTVAWGAYTIATTAAGIATALVASPLLAIVLAAGLLTAAILLLIQNWDEITARFPLLGALADEVAASFTHLAQVMQDANLGEKFAAAFNFIKDFDLGQQIKDANWGGKLKDAIGEQFDQLKDADLGARMAKAIGAAIKDANLGGAIKDADLGGKIKTAISEAFKSAKGADLGGAIKDAIVREFDELKSVDLGGKLLSVVRAAFDKLKGADLGGGLKAAFATAWAGIESAATTAWEGIKSALSGVWKGIKSAADEALKGVKGAWTDGWGDIESAAATAWAAIETAVTTAATAVKTAISDLITGGVDLLKTAFTTAASAASTTFAPALNAVATAANAAKTAASGLLDIINGIASALSRTFSLNINFPSPPGWLNSLLPGSPPPLAVGIDWINKSALNLKQTLDGWDDTPVTEVNSAFSSLAANIAGIQVSPLVDLNRELSRVKLAITEQQAVLANAEPYSAHAAAVEADIKVLEAWSGKIQTSISAINDQQAVLDALATAFDGFTSEVNSAMERLDLAGMFGEAGADAIVGLRMALEKGTADTGRDLARDVQSLVKAAKDAGVPNAMELGAALSDALASGLNGGGPEVVQVALDIMAQLEGAMKERASAGFGFDKAMTEGLSMRGSIAAFGEVGGEAADALMTAFEDRTAENGQAAASAVLDIVKELEASGIPDWRDLGEKLINTWTAAIRDGGPEARDAALAVLGQVTQAIDQSAPKIAEKIGKLISGGSIEAIKATVQGSALDAILAQVQAITTAASTTEIGEYISRLDRLATMAGIPPEVIQSIKDLTAAAVQDSTTGFGSDARVKAIDAQIAALKRSSDALNEQSSAIQGQLGPTEFLKRQLERQVAARRDNWQEAQKELDVINKSPWILAREAQAREDNAAWITAQQQALAKETKALEAEKAARTGENTLIAQTTELIKPFIEQVQNRAAADQAAAKAQADFTLAMQNAAPTFAALSAAISALTSQPDLAAPLDATATAAGGIATNAPPAAAALATLTAAATTQTPALQTAADALGGTAQAALDLGANAAATAVTLPESMAAISEALAVIDTTALGNVADAFAAMTAATEDYTVASDEAAGTLDRLDDAVRTAGDDWHKYGDEIKYAVELTEKLTDRTTEMVDVLRDEVTKVKALGEEVGQGMVGGITNAVNAGSHALQAAIRDLVRKGVDAAKAEIDAGSPSKVTRDEIGKPMVQGMALGVEKYARLVYRAMAGTVDHAVDVGAQMVGARAGTSLTGVGGGAFAASGALTAAAGGGQAAGGGGTPAGGGTTGGIGGAAGAGGVGGAAGGGSLMDTLQKEMDAVFNKEWDAYIKAAEDYRFDLAFFQAVQAYMRGAGGADAIEAAAGAGTAYIKGLWPKLQKKLAMAAQMSQEREKESKLWLKAAGMAASPLAAHQQGAGQALTDWVKQMEDMGMFSAISGGLGGGVQSRSQWALKGAFAAISPADVPAPMPPQAPTRRMAGVPSFAKGITDFAGGLAFVHKNEALVNMARGTDVMTARDTRSLIDSSRSLPPIMAAPMARRDEKAEAPIVQTRVEQPIVLKLDGRTVGEAVVHYMTNERRTVR